MQRELSLELTEGIYRGSVSHRRSFDIEHAFRYPVWMALSALPDGPDRPSRLPALLRPRWSRYLSRARLRELTEDALDQADDRIWLLTQPSVVGRSFNPVSFYFVERGGSIRWIVAHITNTPWDEEHCYVVRREAEDRWSFDKAFHVSPFMPMALQYLWHFRVSQARIDIDMHLMKEERRVFSATLNLQREPGDRWQGLRLRASYPLQNLRTLSRIYYQAAVLKLKGANFYAHPDSKTSR